MVSRAFRVREASAVRCDSRVHGKQPLQSLEQGALDWQDREVASMRPDLFLQVRWRGEVEGLKAEERHGRAGW